VQQSQLPHRCKLIPLAMNQDSRGVLTELFRDEWLLNITPVQWNYVQSAANVLRGVHVHRKHADYLIVTQGILILGLCDLREHSPTYKQANVLSLSGENIEGIVIPPGVAHGFYFPEPAQHIYAVNSYWNLDDELGCLWNDASLGIAWPAMNPLISERDTHLPTFNELMQQLASWQTRFEISNEK
jgi:dTDP-4-dehydrorhamnose 3,5-epimerase